MHRLAILLSGRGSNFLAIHAATQAGGVLEGTAIVCVLSNKADAPGLEAARRLGIAARHIPIAGRTPAARDEEFIATLREYKPDLVCLAGYMRVLSAGFVDAFPSRILNVHPSLLPSFPGLDAQAQAFNAGVKVTGCTVHLVDEQLDHGVILLQRVVPVLDDDTAGSLAARILIEEHRAYPEAIAQVLSGSYRVEGRRFLKQGKA